MKVIMEFGRATDHMPVSGQITLPNRGAAARAAVQLAFVLEGRSCLTVGDVTVNKDQPRIVWWSSDRQAWIAVSLLDDVDRGSYADTAWRRLRRCPPMHYPDTLQETLQEDTQEAAQP
jgi:hypothetical protein